MSRFSNAVSPADDQPRYVVSLGPGGPPAWPTLYIHVPPLPSIVVPHFKFSLANVTHASAVQRHVVGAEARELEEGHAWAAYNLREGLPWGRRAAGKGLKPHICEPGLAVVSHFKGLSVRSNELMGVNI